MVNDDLAKPAAIDDEEIDTLEGVEEPDATELEDEVEDDEDTLNSNQYFDDVSDDSVRLYLREIGKIPLLNAEEELTLANQVVANRDELAEVLAKIDEIEEKEDKTK